MTVYHVAIVRFADHAEVWEQHEFAGHPMTASEASAMVKALHALDADLRDNRSGCYLRTGPLRPAVSEQAMADLAAALLES